MVPYCARACLSLALVYALFDRAPEPCTGLSRCRFAGVASVQACFRVGWAQGVAQHPTGYFTLYFCFLLAGVCRRLLRWGSMCMDCWHIAGFPFGLFITYPCLGPMKIPILGPKVVFSLGWTLPLHKGNQAIFEVFEGEVYFWVIDVHRAVPSVTWPLSHPYLVPIRDPLHPHRWPWVLSWSPGGYRISHFANGLKLSLEAPCLLRPAPCIDREINTAFKASATPTSALFSF